jgi:hypothetical protein
MKTVVSRSDSLELAYNAGLIIGKGSIKIEGIGDRSTNWGMGLTASINGATLSQARQSVGWFADEVNDDKRNQRNGDRLTLRLTTNNEVVLFAHNLGLGKQISKAIDQVIQHDEDTNAADRRHENGNRLSSDTIHVDVILSEHAADSLLFICSSLMEEPLVKEWVAETSVAAFEALVINAFSEGMRGLALGTSDVAALQAGEGILDRYADGDAA